MIGQVTVTVAQGKVLIARAILKLPEVQRALNDGRIVLKSGTTVSVLAEMLGTPPLRIGGRIVSDGTRASKYVVDAPHIVVLQAGKWRKADDNLLEEMSTMGPNDLFITGANALDSQGNAGLLAGIEFGSTAGKAMITLWTEGITTIVAVGLEKLIPGSVLDVCRLAGRKRIDKSQGMAVGIIPVLGKVITEKEAIEYLTGVKAAVIASGGINGAEGAVTILVEGTETEVEAVFSLLEDIGCPMASGDSKSLVSCAEGGPSCSKHQGCIYKSRREIVD